MDESGSVCGECKMLNIKVRKLLFLLCLGKKSESPGYSSFIFVFCFRGFVGSTEVCY